MMVVVQLGWPGLTLKRLLNIGTVLPCGAEVSPLQVRERLLKHLPHGITALA
jgi:hypothetical protein